MVAVMSRRPLTEEFNHAVIQPMLICCMRATPVHPLMPERATIWRLPASGIFGVTKPLGFAESFMPVAGNKEPPSFGCICRK